MDFAHLAFALCEILNLNSRMNEEVRTQTRADEADCQSADTEATTMTAAQRTGS